MIDKTVETDNVRIWLFDYDNEEWERVRNLCLEEDNWLRDNYLPNRCKIKDNEVFYIAYCKDGRPWGFGGVKEYTPNVARVLNRFYAFPYVRSVGKLHDHFGVLVNDLVPNSLAVLEKDYDLVFVSMQMRGRVYNGRQRWWEKWMEGWNKWSNEWKTYEGLVQTYPAEQATCYQNIIYKTQANFSLGDWNPKTMTYQEYHDRFTQQ
jgi:hypothetical protein